MTRFTTVAAILAIAALSLLAFTGNAEPTVAATLNDPPGIDTELREIATHPHSYRFVDQATDRVDGKGLIKVHSTAPLADKSKYVQLRPGSVRYFRTDGAASKDGEHAAISWSMDGTFHSTDIGTPGTVIMVVRSLDGVITWYSLQIDMRC